MTKKDVITFSPPPDVKTTDSAIPKYIAKPRVVPKLFNPAGDAAEISAVYGQLPKDNSYWQGKGRHTGIDSSIAENSPAYAITGGRVINAGFDPTVGNYVSLQTGNGRYINYEHLNSIKVKQGQKVPGGFVIGATGNTGSASKGAHLHNEFVINGNLVAPEKYFNIKNEADEPDWLHRGEDDTAPQNLGTAFQYAGMSPKNISGVQVPTTPTKTSVNNAKTTVTNKTTKDTSTDTNTSSNNGSNDSFSFSDVAHSIGAGISNQFTGVLSNFFGGSPSSSSSSQTSSGFPQFTSAQPSGSSAPFTGAPASNTSSSASTKSLETLSEGGQSPLEQPVGKI
jgi:hypothetical protein